MPQLSTSRFCSRSSSFIAWNVMLQGSSTAKQSAAAAQQNNLQHAQNNLLLNNALAAVIAGKLGKCAGGQQEILLTLTQPGCLVLILSH